MRNPKGDAYKKLEQVLRSDTDISEWWRDECMFELRKLAYASDENFKVVQGRIQAMLELADVFNILERSK